MDIDPTAKINASAPVSAAGRHAARPAPPTSVATAARPVAAGASELEQVQQRLARLPDVDTDKLAALKVLLERGELLGDPQALAAAMLAYHRRGA